MRFSRSLGALAAALLLALWAGAAPGAGGADQAWRWTAAGACPHFCRCYLAGSSGRRTADCAGRRLASAEDLQLPEDTDVADLSDNIVSTLQDGGFRAQGLTRLRELRLASNGIRDVGAWAFAGLRRLRLLDLSHNHLQVLHPTTFDDNRGLKVLLLAGNNFARAPTDRPLLVAPRLQVLDVSDCRLAHLGPNVLLELPALASLNLSANYLIQVQPQALARQRQLQVLDLSRNPLACDHNTRQVTQALAALNATVRTSCPPAVSRGAGAQLSKHLARLQADLPLERAEAEGPGVGASQWSPPKTHERLVVEVPNTDDSATMLHEDHEAETFEDEYYADDKPVEESREDASSTRPAKTDGCTYLFPERVSKNPPLVRDWFDQIPSFWAALFGCQVGLVLGLVLASCACRVDPWHAVCSLCCRTARPSRIRRSRAPPHPDMLFSDTVLDSWSDDLEAVDCEPYHNGLTTVRTRGDAGVAGPAGGPRQRRPETPPPAYADLERLCLPGCLPQAQGPAGAAATALERL